jgi:two-component system sensor histidine kinase KdpD
VIAFARQRLARLAGHGYWLAVLAITLSTAVFFPGRDHFAKGQWSLLYLLIVVVVAGLSGTGPAVLAATLAFFAWNYFFLPPYHTLAVKEPKDWLSLVAFLIVGMAVGVQTGRMREREARAVAREREGALLNRLSVHLVSETSTETMAGTVLAEAVKVMGATSAALFVPTDGDRLQAVYALPPRSDEGAEPLAEWAYRNESAIGVPCLAVGESEAGPSAMRSATHLQAGSTSSRSDVFLPLQTASRTQGVLQMGARSDGGPYRPTDIRLLMSLANLMALFLERQHLQAAATQANALREADRLKSSLLSSVSHELKTPLAALTATVSNLLESDVAWDERSVRDELRAIVDDVTRLNNSIGALLDLSRLEARAWEPVREPYELSEIVVSALESLPAHQRGRVTVDLPDDLAPVDVDFVQFTRVFQNLLENALVYAGASPVRVGAEVTEQDLRMWVEDEGPGIPPDERERVFDKFYRGARLGGTAPSGTGLGLAITREIVKAHGGAVWVEDARPRGARFVIALPSTRGADDGGP